VLRPDGSVIWLEATGRAFFDAKGTMLRIVGMAVDVTERKQAEEALATVSRRLIEAHEEERTWIARELHDDINQRIALLAVNLESLKHDRAFSQSERSRRIKEVLEHVSDLGNDIQALSHRLHSSKLEYLGLVAAAEGFCRELAGQQNVEIDFQSQDIPNELPQEVALCLFRVLQEALQNAVKHSGVRRFDVLLKAASNEIQMSVHDSGVGFDLQKAMSGHGLGFTSMKERMNLIDGHLSIDLKGGTTIHARAPLRPKAMSAGAASQI
jgi:signal transduction histidine kinase